MQNGISMRNVNNSIPTAAKCIKYVDTKCLKYECSALYADCWSNLEVSYPNFQKDNKAVEPTMELH